MRAAAVRAAVVARDAERTGRVEQLFALLPEPVAELEIVRVALEREPGGGEAPGVLELRIEVHPVVRRRQARHVPIDGETLSEVIARALFPGAAPGWFVRPGGAAGERGEAAAEVESTTTVQ